MEREFISFDVASDLAHFRRPYAITTALTFPAPPRTALCGLVGALLGLPKNDGLAKLGDDQALFGLQLLAPYRSAHVSINLLQTKDRLLAWQTDENPHTAMRYEVIREPRYRVFFSHTELGPRLAEMLIAGDAHYTPCLGLAWMIAYMQGEPRRIFAEQVLASTDERRDFISPVRTDDLVGEIEWRDSEYQGDRMRAAEELLNGEPKKEAEPVYQRVRMPAVMQPDRVVTRHQEYVIETTGRPIKARLKAYWKLRDGAAFSAM